MWYYTVRSCSRLHMALVLNTGIKTRFRMWLDSVIRHERFPERGIGLPAVLTRLMLALAELDEVNLPTNLGRSVAPAGFLSTLAFALFSRKNANNLGRWTDRDPSTISDTRLLERECVREMVDLLGADIGTVSGHLTSGATEANLTGVFDGREWIASRIGTKPIAVIRSELTHHSVSKAAHITGLPQVSVPLSSDWTMDVGALKRTLARLYAKGTRGFILVLTIGHTTTGTSDDLPALARAFDAFLASHRGTEGVIHIDGALSGLTMPFADPSFRPFALPRVASMGTDFHKFGVAPYPSGIVLVRRDVATSVEYPSVYFSEKDSTVSGSRSGAAAAAIWTLIQSKGKRGFAASVATNVAQKESFIRSLKVIVPGVTVVTHSTSVHCGVMFPRMGKLPQSIEDRYNLYAQLVPIAFAHGGVRKCRIYRFFSLPGTTHSVFDACLADIAAWVRGEGPRQAGRAASDR